MHVIDAYELVVAKNDLIQIVGLRESKVTVLARFSDSYNAAMTSSTSRAQLTSIPVCAPLLRQLTK